MAIQKRFIHFKKFEDFNSKKLSANEANTQYTVGVSGAVQTGSPDILYQSYCWIKDTKQQWTHGQLYNGSVESDPTFKSSAASRITTSDITNWNKKTSNTGTVTSITPGVGLTNGDGETAITTTGTVNLKLASNSEIGGIKITKVADQTMATTAAKKYWPVNVTTAGVAYVGLPNFTTNSGDITGVTAGNGLTGGATSGTATLNVGAGTGISVGTDAVSVKINNTDSLGTIGTTSKLYAVGVDANGELAVNVPWTDNNTTYGVVSTSANGLAPKVTDTSKFLKGDGTWATPTNTTYSNMTGATSSAAGKAGLVPAPAAGKQASFLRGDGTWVVPTNTTYSNMTGAKASAAGKAGLVPAPTAGKQTSFLRGDGTWAIPTNTTYSAGSGLTLSSTTFNVGAGTGISVAADAIGIKTAQTSEIGGIKIGKDNSSYEVTTQTSSLTANATSGKYYAVEIDKNDKAFVYVPWTDNNTTSFTITASASDDDVVVLSGTNGTNKVTYSAAHAKKGPSSGYTSGNTTTSISGSAASGTISIPQITVDSYGHVTAAADENITIKMPTIPTSLKNPKSLTVGSKTYNGASAVTITAEDLGLSSALKYCGVTTTKLTDGATTNPVTINSANFTATAGSVVFYGSSEFVFNGSKWTELGDGSNHKIKQDAVSSPSASGNATAFIDTISQDANGKITVTKKNVSFPTETSLSGGSAAAANATVVGGVTVSGHKVTVGKKTITGSGLASVSGTASGISINVANPSFGNITSNPFTVDSSGNISAGSKTITAGDFATSSHTLSKKADKSTTLSGYGITNAYTKTETDNKFVTKTNPTGSGYVSFGRVSKSTIGTNSVVIGTNSKATNTNSIAIGTDCTASGENSTVIGTGSTASGLKAISLGDHNTASGEYAFATGCWTNSNGIAGITLGNGSSTHANSWASMSSGIITEARGLAQHVFGSYNIPDAAVDSYSTPAEHLLIVGNGDALSDASYQSNAMTLDWNGNAWFSGDVYVGSTSGTNKDSGSVKLAKAATTLSGYGITNAYTKTESDNRYLTGSRSAYDIDTRYNAGIWMTAGGTNFPSGIGNPYGVVLTLPYRQMSGNSKPDFGCQIFMPNGDDSSNPNSLYFRTSLGDTWNPWQQVATTSMIPTESVISGWGFTKNAGTVTAIKINGTTKSPSNGVIDLGTIQSGGLSSESDPVFKASAAARITTSDISNWNSKTSNKGTITGIKMNGASKGTSGVVDLGTVITAHQDISGKADKSSTVDLTTAQTISGVKSFTKGPVFTGSGDDNAILIGDNTRINVNGTTKTIFGFVDSTSDLTVGSSEFNLKLRGKSTRPQYNTKDLALKSDVPTKVSALTNDSGFTSNKGTITGITMNGSSKGTSGVVNLGTVLTAHQPIKTINGESLIGSGNITISGGSSGSSASSNSYTLDWSTATTGDPSEVEGAMLYPYTLPITSALRAELCSKDSLILYNTNPDFLCDALMGSSSEQFIVSDKSVMVDSDGGDTVMFAGYRTSYASTMLGLMGAQMVTMLCFVMIKSDTIEIVFIVASGSGSGGKKLVTTTSTTVAMDPNKYYRQTSTNLQTLTITLNDPSTSSILNEYLIEFTTASSTTVALPTGIKWSNGQTPIFEPNCTYQISIVNNLGVVTKFL